MKFKESKQENIKKTLRKFQEKRLEYFNIKRENPFQIAQQVNFTIYKKEIYQREKELKSLEELNFVMDAERAIEIENEILCENVCIVCHKHQLLYNNCQITCACGVEIQVS